MMKQNKQLIFKIIFGVMILLQIATYSHAYVVANYGDEPFEGTGEKSFSLNLNMYIVQGASSFLNSYSDMILFLNKVEISELNGIDYKELGVIINRAVENMEQAKAHYVNLKQVADGTPYNPAVIDLLKSFDYTAFQQERGLNAVVFQDVQNYLSKGDVRGIFSTLLDDTEKILLKLYSLKEYTDSEKFPELSTLWRVNQDYSETILFGQFAAEIFFEIKGSK